MGFITNLVITFLISDNWYSEEARLPYQQMKPCCSSVCHWMWLKWRSMLYVYRHISVKGYGKECISVVQINLQLIYSMYSHNTFIFIVHPEINLHPVYSGSRLIKIRLFMSLSTEMLLCFCYFLLRYTCCMCNYGITCLISLQCNDSPHSVVWNKQTVIYVYICT